MEVLRSLAVRLTSEEPKERGTMTELLGLPEVDFYVQKVQLDNSKKGRPELLEMMDPIDSATFIRIIGDLKRSR